MSFEYQAHAKGTENMKVALCAAHPPGVLLPHMQNLQASRDASAIQG